MRKSAFCGLMACICLFGCRSAYKVHVNTLSGMRPIPEAARLELISTDSTGGLLQQEVGMKMAYLLTKEGYDITGLYEPDYFILYKFGLDSRDEAYTKYVYSSSGSSPSSGGSTGSAGSDFASGVIAGVSDALSNRKPVESVRTVNERWLSLLAIDARAYSQTGEFKQVWECKTLSAGESSDLRYIINYMLIPSIENFGRDTGRVRTYNMGPRNRGVSDLEKAMETLRSGN